MKKILSILCLTTLLANTVNVHAQDDKALKYKPLRTDTWSVYVQGGVSWATGLKFRSISPAAGASVVPEVGGGVNYNLRPWVRFGLNYEFSKYKREQQLDNFETVAPTLNLGSQGFSELVSSNGGTAYRNMWNMYHNLDLTAEFNVMELLKDRKCTWFNLYVGTGAGLMFAKGNTYELAMGHEKWTDSSNNKDGHQMSDNWATHSWVKAANTRHDFHSVYVPVILSAEFDVMPQLTLGVKGQYKAVFSSDNMAPDGLEAAALTVRYNFVGSKQGVFSTSQLYREALDKCNELRGQQDKAEAKARQAEESYKTALNSLQTENNRLKQQVKDCSTALENCQSQRASLSGMTILFGNGIASVSKADKDRLVAFAKELKADEKGTISLIGEASANGDSTQNQLLSEKRLNNVLTILRKNGISDDRIVSTQAIGDTNKMNDASHRRVEIIIHP